jgi:CRP/FNR family cyclic AMP-dependent transcriptional regulator
MPKIHLFDASEDYLTYAPGDVVFREGDPGDRMFAVVSGEVEIQIGDRIVDTAGAGDILGEMAVIDAGPRSATAVARTEARLVPVDQRRFLFLVQQTPFFAIQVMQVLTERQRRRIAQMRESA